MHINGSIPKIFYVLKVHQLLPRAIFNYLRFTLVQSSQPPLKLHSIKNTYYDVC